MTNNLFNALNIDASEERIIISIAIMLFSAFAMTRLTDKLKLPSVTAYIVVGMILGPYCFDLIPREIIAGTNFLADIALAFIAFSVGEFFRFDTLKKNGTKVVIITLFEAFTASLAIFILTFYIMKLSLAFSIVLSALASATAPASTMMTIRQTGAKGDFVETLLQVVALDDVVSLIAYSLSMSVALAVMNLSAAGSSTFNTLAMPIITNVLAIIVGAIFGWALNVFMKRKHTEDNRLIIAIAFLFAFCGIAAVAGVSPLLGCMAMGTVYINTSRDATLFRQLSYFSPPILLLFFVRSGLNFNLSSLFSPSANSGGVSLGMVGVAYFVVRIIGKYIGAYLGCLITGKSAKVRNFLGLALIPQAGVAIGLAELCVRTLGGGIGENLETIILSSSVLYEMIGPISAKTALYLSGSFSAASTISEPQESSSVEVVKKTGFEALKERLASIQRNLPKKKENYVSEEEKAFTEAALEQYEAYFRIEQAAGHNRKRRFSLWNF